MDSHRLEADATPRGFADRGIAVPFTTPLITQARVRADTDRSLELVLPNLSGGKGRYILPWRSVTRALTLTVHDRALSDSLSPEAIRSPEGLRALAMRIAAKGLAGPRAAEHANEALARDHDHEVVANFLLVVRLLHLINRSSADLMVDGLDNPESRRRGRAAMAEAAGELGLPAVAVYDRVEALSRQIAPLGLPDAPEPGRLRNLAGDLSRFAVGVRSWCGQSRLEIAQLGLAAAEVATATASLVEGAIAALDRRLHDIEPLIRGDGAATTALVAGLERLQHLLDGWDYLVALWAGVADKAPEDRQNVITDLYRLAPILPLSESGPDAARRPFNLSAVQRRWVRANEDWRSSRLDYDQVRRIEAVKAQMR